MMKRGDLIVLLRRRLRESNCVGLRGLNSSISFVVLSYVACNRRSISPGLVANVGFDSL